MNARPSMTRIVLLALLVPAFALTGTAFAQDSDGPVGPIQVPAENEGAERVAFLLSSYHEIPAKSEFEAIPRVRTILATMATDRTAPLQQKRALEALGYFADDATLAVYTSVLNDPRTRFGVRHQTLLLVGAHFGADGLDLLDVYLTADDLQLRLSAVDAIAKTGTDRGFELLSARAKVETSNVVLERIEKMGRRLR